MLGLALERYFLVCHAARAKQYYKGYIRFALFMLITVLIMLTCSLPVGDFIHHVKVYAVGGYNEPYLVSQRPRMQKNP